MITLVPYSFGIPFWIGFIIVAAGNLIFEGIWDVIEKKKNIIR